VDDGAWVTLWVTLRGWRYVGDGVSETMWVTVYEWRCGWCYVGDGFSDGAGEDMWVTLRGDKDNIDAVTFYI